MKKYLGSWTTAYAAILAPCFIVGPVVFAWVILKTGIDAASVFLVIMCITCSVLWGIYLWKCRSILYAWGIFQKNAVEVKVLFDKTFSISYDKIKSCGIGMYRHAFRNNPKSPLGSNVYFIFLSAGSFPEKYRTQINLWKPTRSQIKVQYSKKLYSYLVNVLPAKQSVTLKTDYKRYIEGKNLAKK